MVLKSHKASFTTISALLGTDKSESLVFEYLRIQTLNYRGDISRENKVNSRLRPLKTEINKPRIRNKLPGDKG